MHLVSFNYKNISRCMVLWMSNLSFSSLIIVLHFFLLLNFVVFNPLNAELNAICHLLTLLGAHHILHVSRIRVKLYLFVIFNCRNIQINRKKNYKKIWILACLNVTIDKLLNGSQHASVLSIYPLFLYTLVVCLWFEYIKVEQICSLINSWSNKVDLLCNDKRI